METKDLKISDQTSQFIACMDSINRQWGMVYDALVVFYGERQASEVMEAEYNAPHDKLREVVGKFLVDSITEKMTNANAKEV